MLLVGLTGNYGSGKSMVLGMFGELGAYTLDADEIVADLLMEGEALARIRSLLGDDVFAPDGSLIKDKVARAVFADESKRIGLEDILHPLVFERIDAMARASGMQIVVAEAALIFERGYGSRFDRIVAVIVPEETAISRLEAAGVGRDEAMRRLRTQLASDVKEKRADYVIHNDGTPEETRAQVEHVFEEIKRHL